VSGSCREADRPEVVRGPLGELRDLISRGLRQALRADPPEPSRSSASVRRRLHERFGLSGEPPAALARRRTRLIVRPQFERLVAQRLHGRERGMSTSRLLAVFAADSCVGEARAAIGRMGSLRVYCGSMVSV
jgi:hypothetical protein